MYHGDMNERQCSKLQMVRKEGMNQWLLVVSSNPAAKGLAKDLEIASAGPVHCHFSLHPSLPCVVMNVVFHLCHHGT